MTRTEDRLTDALTAAARGIRAETIRPLTVPQRPRRRVPGWLVPAAAAMSVIAAVGLALAVTHLTPAPRPFADVGTATSPPPYYVTMENAATLTVRSTATGRVTGTVPAPGWWGPETDVDTVVAGSRRGRVFVAAYHDWSGKRTLLYRFGLTGSGQVAGYASVPGGVLPGLEDLTVAVSPGESQVAVAGIPPHTLSRPGSGPAEIFVVNLHTGVRKVLHGGMSRPGAQFTIASLAWGPEGRTLVFLALWCRSTIADPFNVACAGNAPIGHAQTSQLWEVATAAPGPLRSGHMLLGGPPRYQGMVQAQISPDGKSATVLGRQASQLAVTRRAIPGGRFLGPLSRLRSPRFLFDAALSSDGSGRYLILNVGVGSVFGWLSDGRFHAFAHHDVIVSSAAW